MTQCVDDLCTRHLHGVDAETSVEVLAEYIGELGIILFVASALRKFLGLKVIETHDGKIVGRRDFFRTGYKTFLASEQKYAACDDTDCCNSCKYPYPPVGYDVIPSGGDTDDTFHRVNVSQCVKIDFEHFKSDCLSVEGVTSDCISERGQCYRARVEGLDCIVVVKFNPAIAVIDSVDF